MSDNIFISQVYEILETAPYGKKQRGEIGKKLKRDILYRLKHIVFTIIA